MASISAVALKKELVRHRANIIASVAYRDEDLPNIGSNFFIHLTELCPVACTHCMYASTLTPKSARDSFDKLELDRVIDFINQSRSSKLTISGGGEPFLKFSSILRMVERCDVGRIEIVTAGHWARNTARASSVLEALTVAQANNPNMPKVDLRLSIDRFHLNAPRPVPLANHISAIEAWRQTGKTISLGFRSLLVDWDGADAELASATAGSLRTLNDWNRVLILPDGNTIPITYNILRYSGGAEEWHRPAAAPTKSLRDYFRKFEVEPGKLVLATAVNDALHGSYVVERGVAITLNADGQFWIFCGTAPDRKLSFAGQTFTDAVAHFYRDPITRFLASEGIWKLVDLIAVIDPAVAARAEARDDITSLVDELLADPAIRLQATVMITERMCDAGEATIEDPWLLSTAGSRLADRPTTDVMEAVI